MRAMKKRGNQEPITKQFIIDSVTVDAVTGCWNWNKSIMSNGYGACGVNYSVKPAHRVTFEVYFGPIPAGLYVCHQCDNRRCCNPEHLFAGTPKENIKDMMQKKRNRHGALTGSDHPNSKLKDEQIRIIRSSLLPQPILAQQFQVAQTTISKIKLRKTYASVD